MQHLNCNRLVHQDMRRAVDCPHSTFADQLFDTIFIGECSTDKGITGLLKHRTVEWTQCMGSQELFTALRTLFHQKVAPQRTGLRGTSLCVVYTFYAMQSGRLLKS